MARGTSLAVTWLGHAALRVALDGATILTDPALGRPGSLPMTSTTYATAATARLWRVSAGLSPATSA